MPAKDTNYAVELLDQSYSDVTYSPPATYYVALFTTAPSPSSAGVEVSTSVWTDYVRLAVPNNPTNWGPATDGSGQATTWNNLDIRWDAANITGTPPVVKGVAIFDAASGGNRFHCGAIVNEIVVVNGVTVVFVAGTLMIKEL